jgi:hypothetical protein
MPSCRCSQCFPSRSRALRTIQTHLKRDEDLFYSMEHNPEVAAHLQNCINLNKEYLQVGLGDDPLDPDGFRDQEGNLISSPVAILKTHW